MIEKLSNVLKKMDDNIYNYDIKDFNENYIEFITVLAEYMPVLSEKNQNTVNENLILISNAFKGKDYIFILDIINYEFMPLLNKLANN